MYQKVKKLLAALCVLALVVTALPAVPAQAAATPKYKKTYASLYENGTAKGKYTYTLKNLKKGQKVKWSVSGAGKSYVKLSKTSTKVTGTTASVKLTIQTNGAINAKNKKVTLTGVVYSAAGKKQCTVKTSGKLKIKVKKVALTVPEEAEDVLYVGESYRFGFTLTPVNATSTNVWTVTDENGQDASDYMSSAGVFQPMKAGIYTIKLSAMIGSKVIKSASKSVDVVNQITAVQQTHANRIAVSYAADMRGVVDEDDFTIRNANGAAVVVKEAEFSENGQTITITTHSNFKDAVSYTVSDGTTTKGFTASVGVPVKLEVLTQKAVVGKETTIAYALYDANGVDVQEAYSGSIEYDAEVTNGYITENKKLYMTTIGKTATVKLTYTSKSESGLTLNGVGVITCIAATTSSETNFTLTKNTAVPDYSAASYKDNRRVSIGTTYYAHFRALDTDNTEIKYSSVKYESADPDRLIITKDGKVTPILSGEVKILVTALYAGEEYAYSYDVTVAAAPALKSIELSRSSVTMSNVYSSEYRQYIDVSALDQYGERYPLTSEAVSLSNNSAFNASLATYDAASDRIVLNASSAIPGTYNYTMTMTADGEKATASFSVTVVTVPTTGNITYVLEIDKTQDDLSLTTDVSASRYVNVRLAQYRGGVFTNYTMFTSATVTKGSEYFGNDLTVGGTTAKQTLSASNRLSLKTLDITTDTCRKAQTGTYTITLQYYSSADKGYMTQSATLTLTDSQDEPEITIERITASKSCATALELAQNCLTPDNGMITECVVTGESQPGSKVAVKAGDQVNIRSVTIVAKYQIAGGKEITMTYSVSVGKTLTNI